MPRMMVCALLALPALLACAGCGGPAPSPEDDGRFKATPVRPRPPLQPLAEAPPGRLQVEVFDLGGRGEAALVRCPCPGGPHRLLIDAGAAESAEVGGEERFRRALEARLPAGQGLDVLVVTHEDPAHLGGVPWLLGRGPVGLYVDNGRTARGDAVWEACEQALAEHPPAWYLDVRRAGGSVLDVDFCPRADVGAEVLRFPGFGHSRFADEASVIVRVVHGEAVALFMGDAGREEEQALLRQPDVRARLRCDLLKAGNGGDRSSSTAELLEVARPRLAAIACPPPAQGLNRHLGHPHKVVLDRLGRSLDPRPGGAVTVRACDDEAAPPPATDELGDPIEVEGMIAEDDWSGAWVPVSLERGVWLTAGGGDLRFESDGMRFSPLP